MKAVLDNNGGANTVRVNSKRRSVSRNRRRGLAFLSASQAAAICAMGWLYPSSTAEAANTIFNALTTASGPWSNPANWNAATGAPTGNQAGNIAVLGTAGVTMTLDVATTLGEVQDRQGSARAFVIDANSSSPAMTMDNTGGTATNPAGDLNAFIGSTSSGAVTFQPSIIIANTDLDFYLGGSTQPVLTIGVLGQSSITASTPQTLNTISNSGTTAGITINSSIGASGSLITLNNIGTGTRAVTLAGPLGPDVNLVQQSTTNSLTLSNANAGYTGTTNIASGTVTTTIATTMNLSSVTFGGASTNGTLSLNGGANAVYTVTGLSTASAGTPGSQTIQNISTTNTATLVYTSGTTEYDGVITNGTKALALSVNSGSLTLNGSGNTFTGGATINGGILTTNGVSALGGGNYAGLTFGSAGGTLNYEPVLVDGGDLTQNSKAATLTGNATININGNNISYANSFGGSGAGGLTVAGGSGGSLTLAGPVTYKGNTAVTGGTLFLGSAVTSLSSPVIAVGSGATLDVTGMSGGTLTLGGLQVLAGGGTVNGTISTVSTSILAPGTFTTGSAGTGVLTINNGLNLASGAELNLGLTAGVPLSSYVDVAGGTLAYPSGSVMLNLYSPNTSTPFAAAGTYDILQYATASGTPSFTVSVPGYSSSFGTAAGPGGTTYETLTLTASGTQGVWTGAAGDTNWTTSSNWQGGVPHMPGDTATFNSASATPGTVTLNAPESVGEITFNTASGSYAITGGSTLTLDGKGTGAAIINLQGTQSIGTPISLNDNATITVSSGAQLTLSGVVSSASTSKTLTINGGGTTILSNANTYGPAMGSVGTTLSGGGIVQLGNNSSLSTGDISVTGSATLQAGISTLTLANDIDFSSPVTLTLDNNGGTFTLNGNLNDSGGSAAVVLASAGTTILNGSNTYGGGTTLNGGTVQINSAASLGLPTGALTFNVGTLLLPASTTITTTRNYVIGSGPATINIPGTSSLTNNGIISSTGTNGLILIGSGTLTLGGSNTYSGLTNVSNGTLITTNPTALGSASASTAGLLVANSSVVDVNFNLSTASLTSASTTTNVNISAGSTLTVGGNNLSSIFAGIINGAGSLSKTGSGLMGIGIANYTGNTTVNSGTLNISGGTMGTNAAGGSVIVVGTAGGSNPTLNLMGGSVAATTVTVGDGAVAGMYVSGGSLTATTLNVATVGGSTGSVAWITGNATGTFGTTNVASSGNTGGNLTINTSSGTVSLGVVSINKDSTGSAANAGGGLILDGGNVIATSLVTDPQAHEGDINMKAGSLTIGNNASTGAFELGTLGNISYFTMTGGTLTYAGTDGLLTSPNAADPGTTTITINGATSLADLTGITLNAASSASTSSLTVGTGATLYLDSVGLAAGSGGTVSATFGVATIGATANWSSSSLIPITLSTGSTIFQAANASGGTENITLNGSVGGSGGLTKTGPGYLALTGGSSYSGPTNISAGTLVDMQNNVLGSTTSININGNMIIQNSPNLQNITLEVAGGYNGGAWNGSSSSAGVPITSSAAASDPTHLHALGVIQNDSNNGSGTQLYSTFEGYSSLNDSDVLIKYTYYGDTDLNGEVDGTDYSRIDYAYENNLTNPGSPLTGWFNGDFNYDGVIDGSDYTLIDNAFNSQGAQISAEVASPTGQISGSGASSAVPEPATLGLLGIGAAGLLGRRRRRH